MCAIWKQKVLLISFLLYIYQPIELIVGILRMATSIVLWLNNMLWLDHLFYPL